MSASLSSAPLSKGVSAAWAAAAAADSVIAPSHSLSLVVFMVFNPLSQPVLRAPTRNQLGWYSGDGSVVTSSVPGANAVNLLVELVILNYMALHGEEGQFATTFARQGLGSPSQRDALTAFAPIV